MIREIFLSDFPLSSCVWLSTIFLVVGLVVSFILRHRSARAHQVLFLSMIAAVIVPIMSILVKHYELGVFVAEPVVIQSQAEDRAIASNYGAPGIISAENIEHKPVPVEKDLPPVITVSEIARFPWRSVVLYGWIAASLILATRLVVTFVLGVRVLGRALPLECQRIKEAAHLARAKLGIDKNVEVRSSRSVRSPVIWCWRRSPVLLVPSAAGRFDNGVDWVGVLCHELAHWKRRDHISGLLAELAVCILPWNPLLWWAKSRLVRLSEQACDDWVVATGQPGTDYAESLLDLTPGGQMAFVPAVVSKKKRLAGRIRRILEQRYGSPQIGWRWSIAAVILAACVVIGVAFAQRSPAALSDAGQDKEMIEAVFAEAAQDSTVNEGKVKLCLFDPSGRPVAGAKVGTSVRTREVPFLGSRLSWYLRGKENNVSNEWGEIELTQENLFPASWSAERKAALYVLHEERKIGATCEISKDDSRGEIPLTLKPICHVHGRLSSKALKKIGRPLNLTHVYIQWNRDSFGVLNHTSHNSKEYRFDFLVPPGQYELHAYGFGEGASTETAKPKVEVKVGQSEFNMGVIDLPPTKLALLIGKPAPALGPIKAWKNGSPVKLAELRGKLVILHFGGEYPSPNRDLIELHKEFSEADLVIIGLYNCESMKHLEERFSELSKKRGGEPDVPFRLAIDGGKSRIVEGTDWEVPGETYAVYDIKAYPTTVLIDQKGNVVERLNLRRAREKLESLLSITAESEQPVWKQRLEQVYRLEDNQILKRIAPPFIPARKEYFVNKEPHRAEKYPEGPAVMTFRWRDNQANLWYKQDLRSFSLSNLIECIMEISSPPFDYIEDRNYLANPEGSEELLIMKIPGDWILRDEAPPEAKAQALEKLIADEFGRHISIDKRIVERDVIVATGQFMFSPVYSDEEIVLFADKHESVRKRGEVFVGCAANTVAEFLQQLGWLVSVPVIDRTETTEDIRFEYRTYLGRPSLRRIKDMSEKKDKLRFFLDTLSAQTNLQFKITREPLEVWFVTERKGN